MSLTLQEVFVLKKLNSGLGTAFRSCVDMFVSVQLEYYEMEQFGFFYK